MTTSINITRDSQAISWYYHLLFSWLALACKFGSLLFILLLQKKPYILRGCIKYKRDWFFISKESMSQKEEFVSVGQGFIIKFLARGEWIPPKFKNDSANSFEKIPFQGAEYFRGIRNSAEDLRKSRIWAMIAAQTSKTSNRRISLVEIVEEVDISNEISKKSWQMT